MPLTTPPVRYDLIRLKGGVDQVTPTLSLPPGFARRAANFECSVTGGYTRIAGYERYDGHASPSAALYAILVCTLTGAVNVGDTLVGQASAATGKIIAVNGSQVVITRETGVFVEGEGLTVSATPVGTLDQLLGVDADGYQDAVYRNLAADEYRTSISAVPGAGKILGVAMFLGVVYAWRNNVGNTAAVMYKSSSSGWTAVTLGKELAFTAGTAAIFDGDTVTGLASGATGIVARVVVESGTWASSDAAGRLVLSSTTGAFVAGEALQVSAASKALAGGGATQIALAPGGRYETAVANFGGGTASYRLRRRRRQPGF